MLVLYTQPRCHFCEIMKRMLSKMNEVESFEILDITKDHEARSFIRNKGHKTVPMLYWRVPGKDVWVNKDIDTSKLTGENLGKRVKDAIASTKKDNCLVFDVDGTLTPSRAKIDPAHAEIITDLASKVDIYIITGSDFPKTKEQLGDITKVVKGSYQCAGNELWVNDKLVQSVPEFNMSKVMVQWCKQKLEESRFPHRTGKKHIDLRPGMMNFSILGRGCTKAQRKQLEPYKTVISPTPKPKIKRANTNALVFTQDSVDGLRPQDKDVWFHDIKTSGLSIRSKKSGMTYYTRAKNEKLSRYTLKVKIADTKYMSLEKAIEVHAKNLKQILRDGINPNKATPNVQHQGRHKNVATAFQEKETVKTNVIQETKEASTTDWKIYSGIRYNSGLGLQILASLLNKNPDMKATCLSRYMNGSYRIRGERILDMFETDDMSIFEISRKELITDGRGQHGSRHMSLQNTVLQVCKAIYHHGSAKDKAVVFAK